MFFNTKNELILRDVNPDGSALLQYVLGEEKYNLSTKLNSGVMEDINQYGMYLRHFYPDLNAIEESLNKAPMMVNLLKNRGYKNILFVGHYDANENENWLFDKFSSKVIDIFPPERSHMSHMADPNIIAQFLPIVHKGYAYKGDFKILRSGDAAEGNNRHIMHSLYNKLGLSPNALRSTSQYKHGITEWAIEDVAGPFDAVVFLGVPKSVETFTVEQVRSQFAQYCEEEFDIVDIYYGAPDQGRFFGGTKKDITGDLDAVFSIRSTWDPDVKESGGRPEELEVMKRMISVY